jgi:hypothetical protein
MLKNRWEKNVHFVGKYWTRNVIESIVVLNNL